MKKIERALLSVSDKSGIVEFAQALHAMGVELLSTGGTAKALREADLPVKDISDFTGFPEMLDGRVKTLHPKVHAGLLYMRGNEKHEATMQEHDLSAIDLVCVNLYPFEETVAKPDVTFEDAIENIDIGGPTMIRSAAKNMKAVTVVVDPDDYTGVIEEMQEHDGETTERFRRRLGQKVFARVASYNAAIARYLAEQEKAPEEAPLVLSYPRGEKLRYGENPHQSAVFYKDAAADEPAIAFTEVLHGKAMSYNNYVDGDAALEAVKELSGEPGVAIIKHTNPCGYATGGTLAQAFEAAWSGDPVSAFGSVIAVTTTVDMDTAVCLKGRFVEALIAPDYEPEALEFLKNKSKDIRLLKLQHPMEKAKSGMMLRQIGGGLLVQDKDIELNAHWNIPTEHVFPDDMLGLTSFGVKSCKHVKSNAIMIVYEYDKGHCCVMGMGAGQPNRVDSVRKLAATKTKDNIRLMYDTLDEQDQSIEEYEKDVMSRCVLVSDAFFPFADNIHNAAEMGIKYIVQPGGSKRDEEVISACDQYGIAMAFTGTRHFKH